MAADLASSGARRAAWRCPRGDQRGDYLPVATLTCSFWLVVFPMHIDVFIFLPALLGLIVGSWSEKDGFMFRDDDDCMHHGGRLNPAYGDTRPWLGHPIAIGS